MDRALPASASRGSPIASKQAHLENQAADQVAHNQEGRQQEGHVRGGGLGVDRAAVHGEDGVKGEGRDRDRDLDGREVEGQAGGGGGGGGGDGGGGGGGGVRGGVLGEGGQGGEQPEGGLGWVEEWVGMRGRVFFY